MNFFLVSDLYEIKQVNPIKIAKAKNPVYEIINDVKVKPTIVILDHY